MSFPAPIREALTAVHVQCPHPVFVDATKLVVAAMFAVTALRTTPGVPGDLPALMSRMADELEAECVLRLQAMVALAPEHACKRCHGEGVLGHESGIEWRNPRGSDHTKPCYEPGCEAGRREEKRLEKVGEP